MLHITYKYLETPTYIVKTEAYVIIICVKVLISLDRKRLSNHLIKIHTNKEYIVVSIKDISIRCGVSVATVSKALNNHSDINSTTPGSVKSMHAITTP